MLWRCRQNLRELENLSRGVFESLESDQNQLQRQRSDDFRSFETVGVPPAATGLITVVLVQKLINLEVGQKEDLTLLEQ